MPSTHPRFRGAPLVLLIAALFAVAGFGYMLSQREPATEEADTARAAALAGLEDALRRLEANPNWSTDLSIVAEEPGAGTYPVAYGTATANVSVDRFSSKTERESELVAFPRARYRIISTAVVGGVTVVVRAEVEVSPEGAVQVISQTEALTQ